MKGKPHIKKNVGWGVFAWSCCEPYVLSDKATWPPGGSPFGSGTTPREAFEAFIRDGGEVRQRPVAQIGEPRMAGSRRPGSG